MSMSRQSRSHLSPDIVLTQAGPLGMLRCLRQHHQQQQQQQHNNNNNNSSNFGHNYAEAIRLGSRNDRQLSALSRFRERGCSASTFQALPGSLTELSVLEFFYESFPGSNMLTVNRMPGVKSFSSPWDMQAARRRAVCWTPLKYPRSLYTTCLNDLPILTPSQVFSFPFAHCKPRSSGSKTFCAVNSDHFRLRYYTVPPCPEKDELDKYILGRQFFLVKAFHIHISFSGCTNEKLVWIAHFLFFCRPMFHPGKCFYSYNFTFTFCVSLTWFIW